jgi:hypothetical protein
MSASWTENASSACIGSVPLTRESPSLGASVSGSSAYSRRTSAAGRPSRSADPALRSRPSPISVWARCASCARSPDAPTDPLPGITGMSPAFSMSSSRAGRSTLTPEYPTASVRARSSSSARTASSGSGVPTAAACDRTMAPCRAVRSFSPTGVSASAPNPVFTPYTGASPLSAFSTTERLISIRSFTPSPSRAPASPRATATTSSTLSAPPSTTTSVMINRVPRLAGWHASGSVPFRSQSKSPGHNV